MARRTRHLIIGAIALGAVALFAVMWRAPQIPLLLGEGFPGPVWPVSGQFAQVPGAPGRQDPPPGPPPPEAAVTRFTQSQGRALLVDQGGQLMAEMYGPGMDRDSWVNSYSLVKTLVGALVLRAVTEGRIAGLDTRLPALLGPEAPDIPLRTVLTMTSGLSLTGEPPKPERGKPLDDADYSPFGSMARLHGLGLAAVMAKIQIDPDRQGQFHYQSANTALLGAVLEQVYGQGLDQILAEQIWHPAGAGPARWRQYPRGDRISAYCCLYARPVDWLRVGRFLLRNGGDTPFLRPDLWQDLVQPDLPAAVRRAGTYGLHLRHDVLDRAGAPVQGPFAYLMGHGGQVVYLLPDRDTVVVRFGAQPQRLHSTLYELLAP